MHSLVSISLPCLRDGCHGNAFERWTRQLRLSKGGYGQLRFTFVIITFESVLASAMEYSAFNLNILVMSLVERGVS